LQNEYFFVFKVWDELSSLPHQEGFQVGACAWEHWFVLKCFAVVTVSEEQDYFSCSFASKSLCVILFHTDQKVAFAGFLCCPGNCINSPTRTVCHYKSYPHWEGLSIVQTFQVRTIPEPQKPNIFLKFFRLQTSMSPGGCEVLL